MKKKIGNFLLTVCMVLYGTLEMPCYAMEEKQVKTPTPVEKKQKLTKVPTLRFKAAYAMAKDILNDKAQNRADLVDEKLQQLPELLQNFVTLLVETNLDAFQALVKAMKHYKTLYSFDDIKDLISGVNNLNQLIPLDFSRFFHSENAMSTLLSYAVAEKSLDLVRILLDHGADPNLAPNDFAPIEYTVAGSSTNENEMKEKIKLLLAYGADINQTPVLVSFISFPDTPLKLIKLLLKKGANNTLVSTYGNTALDMAALADRPDIINLLLTFTPKNHLKAQQKPDINQRNSNGLTPLILAAYQGNLAAVKALIKHGADVNLRATEQSGNEHVPTLQAAINSKNENNKTEIVKTLLKHGADVNATDDRGVSPLLRAIHHNNIELVKILLNKGAAKNQPLPSGMTPLMLAAQENYYDIVALLVEYDADQNSIDNDQYTALDIARQKGHNAIVKLLKAYTTVPRPPCSSCNIQ